MTADEFRKLFDEVWRERVRDQQDRNAIVEAYRSNAAWTRFMLGVPGEQKDVPDWFLHTFGTRAGLSVCREYYSLDCVFYEENPNLVSGGIYPAGFDAIIQHENGERVEEEMWNLLMWRGPLKVLMFYDYREDQTQQSEAKARWR